MSIKPIAVISRKLKSNSVQIKKIASIQAISLLMFSMCSVILLPTKAKAETTSPAPSEITTPTDNTKNTPSDSTNNSNTPNDSNAPTSDTKTDSSKPKDTVTTPEQPKPVKAKVTGISGGANISGVQGTQIAVAPSTPIQVSSDSDPIGVQVSVASGNLSMTTTTGLDFTGPSAGSFIRFSGSVTDINAALSTLRYQPVNTGTFTISAQVVPSDSFYSSSNGNFYKAVSDNVTFTDAVTASAALTYEGVVGHLATITSQQENNFVNSQISGSSWIAASDVSVENDWRWVAGPESGTLFWTGGRKGSGGTPVNGLYNNWANGEPNNSGDNENCAELYSSNAQWNDINCDNSRSYIVEFEDPTPPPSVSLQATVAAPPPVLISNCDQLNNIALNPGDYWFSNITLSNNIDCSAHDPMTALFGDSSHPYHGTFDGSNYTISNVNIVGGSNVGLFEYVDSGTIKNVVLANSTITGGQCVGTIVGRATNSNIENNTSSANVLANSNYNWGYGGIVGCYESNTEGQSYAVRGNTYTGTITNNEGVYYYEWVGGITGYLYTYGSSTVNMDNNTFGGIIGSANYYVGGIAGFADIEGTTNVTLNGNFNQGTINGAGEEVGGFMGYAETYNSAKLFLNNNNFDSAARIVNNIEYVGGVAGYLDAYDDAYVEASNNQINGVVSGTLEPDGRYADDSVGGLVGYLYCYTRYSSQGNCVFNNNSNSSDIYTNYNYSGGMIGYVENYGNTIISNNTNTGHIHSNYNGYDGGIVGELDNYYYDSGVDTNITIQNNINSGLVEGYDYAGGLVGYTYFDNDDTNVHQTINILNNTVNGMTSGSYQVGGLVGYIEGYNYYDNSITNLNINDNVVNGVVEGFADVSGGIGETYIEGNSETGKANINLNSNTINGTINNNDVEGSNTGGIAGYMYQYYSDVNINNNLINGNINGAVSGFSYNYGGLVGYGDFEYGNSQINGNTIAGSVSGGAYTGGLFGYYYGEYQPEITVQANTNTNTVTGTYEVGGLMGDFYNYYSIATFDQNLNEGNISGDGNDVGGLFGHNELYNSSYDNDAITTISQNINRGSVYSTTSNAGGLIGNAYLYSYSLNATMNIQDNYNSGSVVADDSSIDDINAGGLIGFSRVENYTSEGYYTTLNIQRSYNSGNVHAYNQNAGGLIGWAYPANNSQAITNIGNSFATGAVSAGSQTGGIIGFMDGNDVQVPVGNGVYFDQTATGQTSCNFNNAGPEIFLSDCTAVNTDGSQPDYFKNNTTNAPLNTWSFVSTWGTQSTINGGLPCLQWENPLCNPAGDNDGDGISNAIENAGPNGGDANGDGIPDYRQRNVAALVDVVSGTYNVIQSSCTQNSSVYNQAESSTNRDSQYDYPVGLTGFTTVCPSAGYTAHISYYIYGTFDTSKITVRKYNPSTGAYATVTGASLANITIGGQPVLKVEYDVTDGGEFDLDGLANGTIVDPLGIGIVASSSPNNGPNTGYGKI